MSESTGVLATAYTEVLSEESLSPEETHPEWTFPLAVWTLEKCKGFSMAGSMVAHRQSWCWKVAESSTSEQAGRDNESLGLAWAHEAPKPIPGTHVLHQGHTYPTQTHLLIVLLPNDQAFKGLRRTFLFNPLHSTYMTCSHIIMQNAFNPKLQKSLQSVSLKLVSKSSLFWDSTQSLNCNALEIKIKNLSHASNVQWHRIHITIPEGKKGSIVRKYWSKAR